MDTNEFINAVHSFADQIETLLEATLEGETKLEMLPPNWEKKKAAFSVQKSLVIGKSSSTRLHLRCEYRLCTNSAGNHLATESSTFKVEFKALKRFAPIVRFEYERNARNKPASHFQFHADSVELGLLLARAGKYSTAAQQQDVHFPMGGDRYRICLEDVIEIVDQVAAAELKRPVTRDSGDQYGVNLGKNELTVCVTNPYDCARAKTAIQDAERISSERFPGPSGDNIQDADRHCIWQALTTIRANVDFAWKIGDAHEDDHPGTPESREMDQANNQTGRDIGLRHEEDEEGAIDECHAKAEDGQLMVIA